MQAKLIQVKEEAEKTKTFVFKPEKKVKFLPGQFFYFTLPKIDFDDPRGHTRHFTISNSPTEGDYIQFTTRISDSGYKNTIDKYQTGELVEIAGPSGTFILDEQEGGKHLFLAGGIGITPFRSFIKYGLDKNINNLYHLVYSDSNLKSMAFYKELKEYATNKNIKVDITLTKPNQNWGGNKGRISKDFIKKLIPNTKLKNYITWICGPPPFVDAMEEYTSELGIKDVRTEKFTGY